VLNRFWLLPFLFALVAPLDAQDDGPIKMTPEFPLTFPLALQGKGKEVTIKFPVLINPATVLKPGMVLRTLYILTYSNSDDSTDLVLAHKGDMEQAYTREAPNTGGQPKMPAQLAHEIEGYRRTVWEVPNNFILAMAQYPTDAMHLIYSPSGKDQDLSDERFSFLDGLFIGLPDGKVTVLAVEDGSKADKAGLKAGDEIVAVGGISTRNDLDTFSSAFVATREKAKEDEVSSYQMTVRSEGKPEARTVDIPMPPSLKSTFLNGP
jgi:hypothetical protein